MGELISIFVSGSGHMNTAMVTISKIEQSVRRKCNAEIARFGKSMTEDAKRLLPSHWLLTRDLVAKKSVRRKQTRFVAGISFKTEGIRDQRRKKSTLRKPKHPYLLRDSTPRKYAIHHEGYSGSEAKWRTKPRRFLSVALQRQRSAFVAAIQRIVAESVKGER